MRHWKTVIFITLFTCFFTYSYFIYRFSDNHSASIEPGTKAATGKLLWQKYNCTACHQLYGMGGYMGPDLTNVISAEGKGEEYTRIFIKYGTKRMPDFHINDSDAACIIAYLKYVDSTGYSPVYNADVSPYGNVAVQKKHK